MTDRWYLGAWLCDAWLSIDYCASTASIFNLFVLSLDRYWSITSPLKYLRRRTKRRAFFMIAAAWALSALWILPVTGWHSMVHPDGLRHRLSEHHCDTEFADNITFKVSRRCIITFYLPAPAPLPRNPSQYLAALVVVVVVVVALLLVDIVHTTKLRLDFSIPLCVYGCWVDEGVTVHGALRALPICSGIGSTNLIIRHPPVVEEDARQWNIAQSQ